MNSHDTPTASKINDRNAPSYACPMHPDVIQDNPGQCPKCGMNLSASTGNADDSAQPMSCCHGPSSHASPATKKTEAYSCPMHPEIQQATPGECPTCGMNLAPVSNKAGGLVRRLFGRRDHNA